MPLFLSPLLAVLALPFTLTCGTNRIPVKAIAGACARIAPADGAIALEVVDPLPNKWPAVYFNFDGTRDLEPYGEVRVRLRNPLDAAQRVAVKVKAVTQQGQMPETSIVLAGGARRTLRLPLGIERFVFDKDPHLKGLKRHPKVGGGASYALAKTYAISVYLPPMSSGGKFIVEAVELVPDSGRAKPRVLNADSFCPWVDAFGQAKFADFPAKIHTADDLRRQHRAESAELAAKPEAIPQVDEYGGWAGGPQLAATGHFRTEKVDGRWWLVDPAGHLYFAQGINCGWDLTPTAVQHREEYFETLPPKDGPTKQFWTLVKSVAYRNYYSDPTKVPYWAFSFQRHNLWLKYGENYLAENEAFQARRCHAWGINCLTGASWGLRQKSRIPYHTSFGARSRPIATAKGYWGELLDPFAPEFETNCLKAAAALAKVRDDPWCVGCTVNNELSWGPNGASLARAILKAGDDQPAKAALVKLLAARGKTPETATDDDCRALGLAVAERYYSTVRRALKSVAPQMLYLGDRNDKRNPETLIAASRFCDVVTVNTYDFQASVELPPGAEDRPLWVTEFHFGCYDTGYFYASLIPVTSQAARAEAYRAFLRSALDSPSYVGANWFCWRDQPITGVIGESANSSCGVVSVTDVPYRELTDAMKSIAAEMYRRHQKTAGANLVRVPVTEAHGEKGSEAHATGAGAFEIDPPRAVGGPVLKAADYGFAETNDHNGAALARALADAKAKGARGLDLAPGTYRFFDDEGVTVSGFTDFTLDGKGALLVFRRPSDRGRGPNFAFANNERFVARNFKMDWDWVHDPLASLGTCVNKFVDETRDDASYIDMKLDRTPPCYPATPTLQTMTTIDRERRHLIGTPPNRLVFLGNAKGPKSAWIAPDVLRIWPGVKPAPDARVTPHYVCYYNPRQNRETVRQIPVGISYRLLHYYYGKGGITMTGNRHFTLADVDIWSCYGHGLGVGGEQHHWQVVNVRLAPPADKLAERLTSSTADGHHVSRSLGWCKYDGFEISFCNDDSHNFHDCTSYGVPEGENRLRATFSGGLRSLGARVGDVIELRENNFDPTGWRARVTALDGNVMTMARPVPRPRGDRFLFFNRSMATDHILMRRCVCRDSHFRNLFQSNDMTLEDCTFERMGSAAVQLTGSWVENLWCEGMGVTNVVVRNCLFKNGNQQTRGRDNGWAAEIYSCLEMTRNPTVAKTRPGFFSRILVEGNRFENCAGLIANLIHVTDFTFRDNLIVDDGSLQPRRDLMGGFHFRNSIGVTIENNRWQLPAPLVTPMLSHDLDCANILLRDNRRSTGTGTN